MEFYKHCISTPVIQNDCGDERKGDFAYCSWSIFVLFVVEIKSSSF